MGTSDIHKLLQTSGSQDIYDAKFASWLDEKDELRSLSDEFIWPSNADVSSSPGLAEGVDPAGRSLYLCGNSLGLCAKRSKELIQEEVEAWSRKAVLGWTEHTHGRPWLDESGYVAGKLAKLLGAKTEETVCMQTLTVNLHLLMAVFYKPTQERYKILFEEKCFPSDRYMFTTQAQWHGFDPKDALIPLKPREGEFHLRHEDILEAIEREGDSIAVVLFPGIQYYTGQVFDMQSITAAGKAKGCIVGWDLAHAIGNVPMQMHEWGADFACFCTYKYLNSGPGGVGGMWVHERNTNRQRLGGWWAQRNQFDMGPVFDPVSGAPGFQISTPSPLLTMALLGSLEVFDKAGDITKLRAKSSRLTGYLDALLKASRFYAPLSSAFDKTDKRVRFTIITPEARATQLSLLFLPSKEEVMEQVYDTLLSHGVVGDERKPDVIRLSPVPLYCGFEMVRKSVEVLELALAQIEGKRKGLTNGHV